MGSRKQGAGNRPLFFWSPTGGLVLRTESFLYRLLWSIPYRISPYTLTHARVGADCLSYARVSWKMGAR